MVISRYALLVLFAICPFWQAQVAAQCISNTEFEHLTVEDGLSQNGVISIAQDQSGFMWFGSRDGLNKYDGRQFELFRHSSNDPATLSSSLNIYALLSDRKGNMWAGTSNGLNLYLPQSNSFKRFTSQGHNPNSLSHNSVRSIYEDREGHIWVGTDSGLNRLANNGSFHRIMPGTMELGNSVKAIYEDSAGNIWIGTNRGLGRIYRKGSGGYALEAYKGEAASSNRLKDDDITCIIEAKDHCLWIGTHYGGLFLLNLATNDLSHFVHNSMPNSLSSDAIRKLLLAKDGKLWIATLKGINIYDPALNSFAHIQNDPDNVKSLNHNSVYDIFQDRTGVMWIGTYYGGINILYNRQSLFKVYRHTSSPNSLSSNVIGPIAEDKHGNLLVGTEAEGLNYIDWKKNRVTAFKSSKYSPGAISSNLVKAISIDKEGRIWVGTHEGGLDEFELVSGRFRRYKPDMNDPSDLHSHNIMSLLHDKNGRFWVGTEEQGLFLFDFHARRFRSLYQMKGTLGLKIKLIKSLYQDRDLNLWAATDRGLCLLKNSSRSFIVFKEGKAPGNIPSGNINTIFQDSAGRVWIGTYNAGLCLYDPKLNSFKAYSKASGLPANNVLGIVEDNHHTLWISTDNGLCSFKNGAIKTYTSEDGLPGNVFNNNSCYKNSNGELFFGGYSGMVCVLPDKVNENRVEPPIAFTRLRLFNKQVAIGDASGLLKKSFSQCRDLWFSASQDIFTVEFAVLNYDRPKKNKYAYKLAGFETDWNYVNTPVATFTNLPAGTFNLLVKGANNDGLWSKTAIMAIHVSPPVWRTWWACLFYIGGISGVLFLVVRFMIIKGLFKKEHEMHQMKMDFFTNVSHEIRTPLTLIVGPLENLQESMHEDVQASRQLQSIRAHAGRLSRLVNELLDFRKADSNNMKLAVSESNFIQFAEEIYFSFQYLADEHHITFLFITDSPHIPLWFDKDQLEKVLYNLLSNAFKFTPDYGHIQVTVDSSNEQYVELNVIDNGRGIPEDKRGKLFTDFYQIEGGLERNVGTGIGLALSKRIAVLHKGDIFINDSHEGKGSCFVLRLKKGNSHFAEDHSIYELIHTENEDDTSIGASTLTDIDNEEPVTQLGSILVVEDNPDVRDFIVRSLAHHQVLQAANGREAFETATELIPDLIVSDIKMPEMNGLELCKALKSDQRTSHIPVILLTARTGNIHHVNGLRTGADVYLTKPFTSEALRQNVFNLLSLTEKLRLRFSQHMLLEPSNVLVGSNDQDFLIRCIAIIETNLDNDEFGVLAFASEIGMSAPVLYKKINALTTMSVNNFIKSVRLKRAAQLLRQGTLNVNQVAYEVGFSDSKYFSRQFKKQFGVLPSSYT